jgi:hypothetical protein
MFSKLKGFKSLLLERKIKNDDLSPKEHQSIHKKELNKQVSNIVNKILFDLGNLSSGEINQCLEDDVLFAISMNSRNQCFMNWVNSPFPLAQYSIKGQKN